MLRAGPLYTRGPAPKWWPRKGVDRLLGAERATWGADVRRGVRAVRVRDAIYNLISKLIPNTRHKTLCTLYTHGGGFRR